MFKTWGNIESSYLYARWKTLNQFVMIVRFQISIAWWKIWSSWFNRNNNGHVEHMDAVFFLMIKKCCFLRDNTSVKSPPETGLDPVLLRIVAKSATTFLLFIITINILTITSTRKYKLHDSAVNHISGLLRCGMYCSYISSRVYLMK